LARSHARVAILDVATRQIVAEIAAPADQPRGECRGLAVSSDGRFAATCHSNRGDESLRLWDLEQRVCVYRKDLAVPSSTIAISPTQDWIAVGGFIRGHVMFHEKAAGDPIRILAPPADAQGGISALAVSPRGNLVAAISHDRCLIWTLAQP